jgi:hypothetical protein
MIVPRLCRTAIAAVCLTVALQSSAAEVGAGLSLRISDEAAPAGSIVQIKIDVTEPKPISTGRGKAKIKGVSTVEGIVLMNEGQDTYGVALADGDELTFAITSPSNLFGTPADYPILGIAGRVAAASLGTTFPLTLDAAGLGFRDPSGALYPTEITNGTLTVKNGVTIGDVSPGSSVVPAGGVVHISGTNFTPATRLQLSETSVVEQRFVNSGRIDVVLGQTTNMHGLRIRARNDDKNDRSESEYFSYERTTADGASNDSLLRKAVPLFSPITYTVATVDLPARAPSGRRRAAGPSHGGGTSGTGSSGPAATIAFAVQNLHSSAAAVSVELLDGRGNPYAINTVSVGPDRYLVRELGEVFGSVSPPAAFRIRSSLPIQVLGLTGDHSAGTVGALPPH